MRNFFILILILSACCRGIAQTAGNEFGKLNIKEAERLAALPLKCLQKEYPNKLSQTLADSSELLSPKVLHPSFYGCFDWHSSVHGHWMLVRLLKTYPRLSVSPEIRRILSEHITPEKIGKEVAYFLKPHERSYERTYGWAWLLKLAEELHTWKDPQARRLEADLQPLTDKIVELYLAFLPKLNYPIRVGEHTNTAFGLAFAWDYAKSVRQDSLRWLIEKRALDFYFKDEGCPLSWEPGGYDFFSPCLEEADLMRRVLSAEEYRPWLKKFLPSLSDPGFVLEPGRVSDRSDGKLVHLDGLNFSRARCLYGIIQTLPEYSGLKPMAQKHIQYSLPSIIDGSYEGEHWLASFALLGLISME